MQINVMHFFALIYIKIIINTCVLWFKYDYFLLEKYFIFFIDFWNILGILEH